MITSVANDKVKLARSLARKKELLAAKQFLIEGTRLVAEAARAGVVPALVFFERSAFDTDARLRQLVVDLQKETRDVYEVNGAVMRAVTDTETPAGIAAVVPIPELKIPASPQLILILDRVRDPGNLGTMLRTAWAANVQMVWLAPETADPYNPKVVRAAMGAHFHVPIQPATWSEITGHIESIPRVYLAASPRDSSLSPGLASFAESQVPPEINYSHADWTQPLALIIGGEAEGASETARRCATAMVTIPMPGHTESLNAAVAAGILLFEAISAAARPH